MNAEILIPNVVNALKAVSGKDPCKKTVQKIVYLIEQAGGEEGFDYTIHFYGPYSEDLDYDIQGLTAKGILKIAYTDHGHLISVSNKETVGEERLSKLERKTIQHFGSKSPYDLELLATALFVQRSVGGTSHDAITNGVKKIKGSKYSEHQITDAIQELRVNQYF